MPTKPSATAAHGPHLTLRTLGTCDIRGGVSKAGRDTAGEPRFGPGKPLALITYLAHAPRRTALRDHLVELLWADVDPALARQALRQTLWYIKRTLGPGIIVPHDEELKLSASLDSDALAFLSAVDNRDAERAVALYTGEFLPSIALPGGAEFERWADVERTRLRSMFTRSAEEVAHILLANGKSREALVLSRRARDAEPDDERLWRRVFEAHIAASDHVGACVEADRFERLWTEDEREPEPATIALLRQARHSGSTAPATEKDSATLTAALIGRSAEFAQLNAAWDEVQRGAGSRHVHISAPAGLGKSRLLSDLRARLRAARSRVVLLRAKQGERQIPFAFAAEIAGALAKLPGAVAVSSAVTGVLVELNPALSSVFPNASVAAPGADALRRRTIAIRELISAVSDDKPVALLVDDVHWADAESHAMIAALGEGLGASRVLFVTAARDTRTHRFADTTQRVSLSPLDERGTAELVASIAELPDAAWSPLFGDPLRAATGGSPLLILEVLQLAIERGVLARANGVWKCPARGPLETLIVQANPLSHRLSRLSPDELANLRCMSIAGVPLSPAVIAHALHITRDSVDAALHALEVRGLAARQADELWSPSHDEIAAGALLDVTDVQIRDRRARLGAALSDCAAADRDARIAADVLAKARDVDGLAALLLARFHAQQATRGRKSAQQLWSDIAGAAADATLAKEVIAKLPYRMRHPRRIPALAAMALLAIAATVMTAALRPHADVVLHLGQLYTDSTIGESAVLSLPSGIELGEPIELGTRRSSLPKVILASTQTTVASPDGSGWYSWRAFTDSGGLDLTFIDRAGHERRLTDAISDDESPSPAPDNSRLLFETTRYDSAMKAKIATLVLPTNTVSQFLRPQAVGGAFMWSPDGSRIAAVYRDPAGGPNSLCINDADGSHERCTAAATELVGWIDESSLLVGRESGELALFKLNADSLTVEPTGIEVRHATISPDRKWVIAQSKKTGYDGYVFWIASIGDLAHVSVLEWNGQPVRAAHMVWDLQRPTPSYVQRMRIAAPDTAGSFAALQLSTEAFDVHGNRTRVGAVRWFSLDPTIADVSPGGLFVPVSAGRARVVATAGGWRADTAEIVVRDSPATSLSKAGWTSGQANADWQPFGEPMPAFVTDGPKRALHLAGDSSFTTGVRFVRTVSLKYGVAVRAHVKVPVTAPRWQSISLRVRTAPPDSVWKAWDRKTGDHPQAPDLVQICGLDYPASEGPPHLRDWSLSASNHSQFGSATKPMLEGRWFWIELQVLPDGRCGVAIDGDPFALSLDRQPVVARSEISLEAKSVRTRVVTDSVEVFQGVLHSAWWAAMDGRRKR